MSIPEGMIYYHDNRRGSRIIPLQSYGNPSPEEKFAGLDYFDFQLKDVRYSIIVYHCIFLNPNSSTLYQQLTQRIIVKYTKHQLISKNEDMQLQCVFYFYFTL